VRCLGYKLTREQRNPAYRHMTLIADLETRTAVWDGLEKVTSIELIKNQIVTECYIRKNFSVYAISRYTYDIGAGRT
jgi:hypothetical protein